MYHSAFEVVKSSLYVVATPIGNLDDISIRALAILRQVNLIAAEDTRITRLLLKHFNIRTPLLSLREYNESRVAEKIIARIATGECVAQVSDAGTPAISDPGAILVEKVRAAGFPVIPIPGCSALTTALSVAGLRTSHFLFYGFLPPQSVTRCNILAQLKQSQYPIVFYETPHRIVECLLDLAAILGADRQIVLARELTKSFETIRKMSVGQMTQWVQEDINQQRGEFVLIVDAAPPVLSHNQETIDRILRPLMAVLPLTQAVILAKEISGLPRNVLYEYALKINSQPYLNENSC